MTRVYVITAAGLVVGVHATPDGAAAAVKAMVESSSPDGWFDGSTLRWAVWEVLP